MLVKSLEDLLRRGVALQTTNVNA